jgi:dTDP-4-amino-4,6-dideoxy-D-galactose acyltransferase
LKLYHLWIKNSVNKKIATDVLVYIENKHEQGLITLNIKDNYGNIGLFSVDEKYRGKSVGKKLMQAAFSKMAHNNIQEISVSTQKANFPACHFYEYQGFILKNQINIYHLWL